MACGQSYLVAVAGISCSGTLGDDALGQLAGQRVGHGSVDVAGAGDAHCLVNVGAARQRVADGAAKTGGRAAEGLDFGGMVVGLVLELQQPAFGLAVHVKVHIYGAGVVFLALLQVLQLAVGLEPTGADGGEVHQVQGLFVASKLMAHVVPQVQGLAYVVGHGRILHLDVLQPGGEGGVAAVVAPVCVEYSYFGFLRVAALGCEVFHGFHQVVGAHGQAHAYAEGIGVLACHG